MSSWDGVVQQVTVSEKGWIVIPKAMRDRLGIEKGDTMSLVAIGDSLRLIPVPPGDPVEHGYGLLSGGPQSLTEGLLADRQWELEQEERDLPPPRPRYITPQYITERRVAEAPGRYDIEGSGAEAE